MIESWGQCRLCFSLFAGFLMQVDSVPGGGLLNLSEGLVVNIDIRK